jgi:hypothetical protein
MNLKGEYARLRRPAMAVRLVAMLVAVAIAMATYAIPAIAVPQSDNLSPSQVSTAIDHVAALKGKFVADAALSTSDGTWAARTKVVDVPSDPSRGVRFTDPAGERFTVNLPGAAHSGRGARTLKGIVAYSGIDSSANAVIPTDEGAQFLTTINSPRAPIKYEYTLALPKGDRLEVPPGGMGAVILNSSGGFVGVIARPSALDAVGKPVPTQFTVNGTTLTQTVSHRQQGVTYPVVADPYLIWQWFGVQVLTNRNETNNLMFGATAGAVLASRLPPPYGWFISGVGALYAAYAGWIYNRGGCLGFTVTYWGAVYPWYYYGWPCV